MKNQKRPIRLLATAFALMLPLTMSASSHREAPGTAEDQYIDNTDVYVFRSPDRPDTVTIVANYIPFELAQAGPNFYKFSDSAVYDIHIDNNGDANDDIVYRFDFRSTIQNNKTFLYNTGQVTSLTDPDLNVRQYYSVTRFGASGPGVSMGNDFQVAPANIGPRSTPNYETALGRAAITDLGTGGKVFAGPRDDPFFVDLGSIFDLAALRPIQNLHLIPTPGASSGVDGLKGYNVHTIAIQVPISAVTANGSTPSGPTSANAIIGVWATASRSRTTITTGTKRQNLGGFTQVSRLGMPLVNEVVLSLKYKDIFNTLDPTDDAKVYTTDTEFQQRVTDPELGKLIELLYPGVDVPPAPRTDLVAVFLTGLPGGNQPPNVVPAEMIRVNLGVPVTSSPSRLGALAADAQGFPNGRRLTDDVVDIELRVVAGVLVPGFNIFPNNALTDGVDANDKVFGTTFPYLATPHQGYEANPGSGPVAP